MLTEELKARLKRHMTDDFESSMTDSEEVSDGIGDSISAGLIPFEDELNQMSQEDQDSFWEYFDVVLTDLIEEWEEQREEEEDE